MSTGHKPVRRALQYSFRGKRVLIVGAGPGIGRSLIKRLYDDGAKIFAIDKNPKVVEQLKRDFPKVRAERGDKSEWDNIQSIIDSFGPVDMLVNNACVAYFSSFMETTEHNFDRHINNNLKGMFSVTQAVAKGMIAAGNGGAIVTIGSLLTLVPSSVACAYSVSKAAGDMLTKNLAVELGKHGIRVNGLIVDATRTELLHDEAVTDNTPYFSRRESFSEVSEDQLNELLMNIPDFTRRQSIAEVTEEQVDDMLSNLPDFSQREPISHETEVPLNDLIKPKPGLSRRQSLAQVTDVQVDDLLKPPPDLSRRESIEIMESDDIVDSTLFLLSPMSAITNGHIMVLDGGISIEY